MDTRRPVPNRGDKVPEFETEGTLEETGDAFIRVHSANAIHNGGVLVGCLQPDFDGIEGLSNDDLGES